MPSALVQLPSLTESLAPTLASRDTTISTDRGFERELRERLPDPRTEPDRDRRPSESGSDDLDGVSRRDDRNRAAEADARDESATTEPSAPEAKGPETEPADGSVDPSGAPEPQESTEGAAQETTSSAQPVRDDAVAREGEASRPAPSNGFVTNSMATESAAQAGAASPAGAETAAGSTTGATAAPGATGVTAAPGATGVTAAPGATGEVASAAVDPLVVTAEPAAGATGATTGAGANAPATPHEQTGAPTTAGAEAAAAAAAAANANAAPVETASTAIAGEPTGAAARSTSGAGESPVTEQGGPTRDGEVISTAPGADGQPTGGETRGDGRESARDEDRGHRAGARNDAEVGEPRSADTDAVRTSAPDPVPVTPSAPRSNVEGRLEVESATRGEGAGRVAPASGRAVEVDAGVRLQNAAPQMSAEMQAARATSSSSAAPRAAGNVALDQMMPSEVRQAEAEGMPNRIARGLGAMVSQRGGVMTMRLTPPELGALRIEMSLSAGAVTAQFTATSQHAGMLLDRNMAALRTALESHGLTVERLGVQVSGPSESGSSARSESGDQSAQQQQQGTDAQDRDAAGAESRGRRDGGERRSGRNDPAAFNLDLEALTAEAAALATNSNGDPS